jgi:hypothetical protein
MNRRRLLLLVIAAIVVVFAWTRFATHHAPDGQPPLVYLDPASLVTLKTDFNSAAGETRIVVLLSPT